MTSVESGGEPQEWELCSQPAATTASSTFSLWHFLVITNDGPGATLIMIHLASSWNGHDTESSGSKTESLVWFQHCWLCRAACRCWYDPTTKVKLIIMWMEFVCYSRQKLHNFWRKCNSEIQSRRKRCISWHQSPDDLGFYKSYHIPIKYFCNAVSLHALERLLKSFTDLNLKFETVQSSTLCFETHIFGSRTFSSSFLSALSCDRPHCRTCSHFIKATWMCLMGRRHRG